MHQDKNQSKNNLLPIAIGFFLIVIVTIFFFFKSSWTNKEKINMLEEKEELEKNNDLKKYSGMDSNEVLKRINSNGNLEIIDIRESNFFSQNHIIDAKNISLDELGSNFIFTEKDLDYLIVDDSSITPKQKKVMDLFLKNKFKNVFYLKGGMHDWINELNPVIESGDLNSLINQSKVNYIKNEELRNLMEQDSESLYLIDLRSENEFLAGHLKNAFNIPLEKLEIRRKEIPKYKRIIIYDNSGPLAFQGAVRLFDMGILNVSVLSDGLNTWKQKGFEVVK